MQRLRLTAPKHTIKLRNFTGWQLCKLMQNFPMWKRLLTYNRGVCATLYAFSIFHIFFHLLSAALRIHILFILFFFSSLFVIKHFKNINLKYIVNRKHNSDLFSQPLFCNLLLLLQFTYIRMAACITFVEKWVPWEYQWVRNVKIIWIIMSKINFDSIFEMLKF